MSVIFDAHDPDLVAGFWADLLGREVVEESRGPLLPGSDTQVALQFSPSSVAKVGRNRVHLHLTSDDAAHQGRTVVSALELGASRLDVGQRPEEGHVVLADPEGNELCVIEPGNKFLAGCGFLGEVACEGTRAVGLFWAEALGWPLVWDDNGETAIQSPHGGTKVAWGGPPLAHRHGPDRQRFHLSAVASALSSEVAVLTRMGAAPFGSTEHGDLKMTDPDGKEFLIAAT